MQLEDVRRNYDSAAVYYDVATDLVFHRLLGLHRWRRRLIARLELSPGATVLDVGCGTGNNFPLIEQAIGSGGRIIGVDYSSGMLGRARDRCRRAGWTNVTLVQGDAARLERVTDNVDATVSAWCLGIVHDLPQALRRFTEVTRSGGRIAVLDFDRAQADRGPLRHLYPVYCRILIGAGIDSPEDLEDDRLRARWESGRKYLRDHLEEMREERYLWEMGLLISGSNPA
ncbi:MAG: class I SAM-dependent methyltransferase [Pseudomonadales bacterium]